MIKKKKMHFTCLFPPFCSLTTFKVKSCSLRLNIGLHRINSLVQPAKHDYVCLNSSQNERKRKINLT